MKLEEDFRFNLLGQLSSEKSEVDVNIASKIARELTVSFTTFFAENCFEYYNSGHYCIKGSVEHPRCLHNN